jgi:hypothetical protein
MHTEALGGGVTEFDAAVRNGVCPYLSQLGDAALGEMRAVYEQIDAGDYSALGELAERLAATAGQQTTAEPSTPEHSPQKTEPKELARPRVPEPVSTVLANTLSIESPAVVIAAAEPENQPVARLQDIFTDARTPIAPQPTATETTTDHIAETLIETPLLMVRPEADVTAVSRDTLVSPEPVSVYVTSPELPKDSLMFTSLYAAQEEQASKDAASQYDNPVIETAPAETNAQPKEQTFMQNNTADTTTEELPPPALSPTFEDAVEEATETEVPALAIEISAEAEPAPQPETATVFYDDFTEALQSLIAPPTPSEGVAALDTSDTLLPADETVAVDNPAAIFEPVSVTAEVTQTPELPPPPAIVETVVEHMNKLDTDEKQTIAPLLQEIAETIQAVSTIVNTLPAALTSENAAPSETPIAIEETEAKLEQLVTTLFECLGIVYESADIRAFVATLLRTDFKPPQPADATPVDVERQGTHEIKLHFAHRPNRFPGFKRIGQLLGGLVLLYVARHSAVNAN